MLLAVFVLGALFISTTSFAKSNFIEIRDLPGNITYGQVEALLRPYGNIVDIFFGTYRSALTAPYAHARRSHWHVVAYVALEDDSQAREAIRHLNQRRYRTHYINVKWMGDRYRTFPWE